MAGVKRSMFVGGVLILVSIAFASGFEIRSAGSQTIDPTTGVITLAQGGRIWDQVHDLEISGSYVELRQGDFLRARDASISTSLGKLQASNLNYLVGTNKLTASGKIVFNAQGVKGLTAGRVLAHFGERWVIASGGVRAEQPLFQADTALYNEKTNEVFALGNVRMERNGSVLQGRGSRSAVLIQLNNSRVTSLAANSSDPRYKAYLEMIEANP